MVTYFDLYNVNISWFSIFTMSTLPAFTSSHKWVRWTALSIAGVMILLSFALVTSPYLRRWASLRNVDFYDYDKLPARPIAGSDQPSPLPNALDGDWIKPLAFSYHGQPINDEAALGAFLAAHATTAFVLIRDGKVLDERYFNGFGRETVCKSFSVSKSVLSALIGIAVADGLIDSLDDPVTKHLPGMKDPRFSKVTLRHCLDLTAGIRYTRGVMPWKLQPRMYYTTDMRSFIRDAELQWGPDTSFVTEDLSPQILGCVLEKALERHASVRTISAYFREKLWQPLGAEYDACGISTAKRTRSRRPRAAWSRARLIWRNSLCFIFRKDAGAPKACAEPMDHRIDYGCSRVQSGERLERRFPQASLVGKRNSGITAPRFLRQRSLRSTSLRVAFRTWWCCEWDTITQGWTGPTSWRPLCTRFPKKRVTPSRLFPRVPSSQQVNVYVARPSNLTPELYLLFLSKRRGCECLSLETPRWRSLGDCYRLSQI
jgi:CubicO group peptidase (beta-lactamase class C family)